MTKDRQFTNHPEITPEWIAEMRRMEADEPPKFRRVLHVDGGRVAAMLHSMFTLPSSGAVL